jgi:signal transduction histidine kinase
VRDDVPVPARFVAGALGAVLGLVSLSIAADSPAYSFAGTIGGAAALLVAGWSLIAAGLVFWSARRRNYVGPVLVAAGVAWFVGEWDNPGVGSAAVFTVGLVVHASCPVLVAVVMFAHPSGRMSGWAERLTIAALATAMVVSLGVLAAAAYDPQAAGCRDCPTNLVLVDADSARSAEFAQAGIRAGWIASVGVIGVAGWRAGRSSAARRRVTAPTIIAGGLYFIAVASTFVANRDRGYLGSGPVERRLWFVQAGALVLVAAAVVWGRVRNRHTRRSLVDVVVELGKTSGAGGLREVLAARLADPDLEVGYAIGDERWATVRGTEVTVSADGGTGRTVTPLVRDGEPVAVIVHREGVLDDVDLVAEVTSSARLLLDNERLQAGVHAREADLRASRARIVESGDAERRRLERDLHDGAQQRLVGLLLGLRLAKAGVDADDEMLRARLGDIEVALELALGNLREVASGIHPPTLSAFGLAEALAGLAERTGNEVRVKAVPRQRLPTAVETAAYHIVAEAAAGGPVVVDVASCGDRLRIEVEAVAEPEDLIALEDRVGALDGWLRVDPNWSEGVALRAEIPCAS